MLYRSLAFVGASCRRLFHSSAALLSTHYEILRIPTTASTKEIKSAFYHLSKLSHPDHNPSDPSASHRFVRISEAYAVLRSPERRHHYDREIGLRHTPTAAGQTQSRYGPAGGRAATGLTRRRGTFKGAPPSFHRSGGWGEHSAKRRAAQEGSAMGTEGGLGYGQSAWGWTGEEARHFDRESHFRTHSNQERRMRGRARGVREEDAPTGGVLGNFLVVGGLISIGVMGPWWLVRLWGKRERKKVD